MFEINHITGFTFKGVNPVTKMWQQANYIRERVRENDNNYILLRFFIVFEKITSNCKLDKLVSRLNLVLMLALPDFSKFRKISFFKATRSKPNKSHLRIMGSL